MSARLGRWLGRITGKEGDEGAKLIGIGDNSTAELSHFAQGKTQFEKGERAPCCPAVLPLSLSLFMCCAVCRVCDMNESDILNGHNKLRKGAGLKPVKWSGALAKFMRGHLKTLHQQNACRMMHSTNQQRTKVTD